jgi:hypothetical protein
VVVLMVTAIITVSAAFANAAHLAGPEVKRHFPEQIGNALNVAQTQFTAFSKAILAHLPQALHQVCSTTPHRLESFCAG